MSADGGYRVSDSTGVWLAHITDSNAVYSINGINLGRVTFLRHIQQRRDGWHGQFWSFPLDAIVSTRLGVHAARRRFLVSLIVGVN
jgi:hypothetical protein